jgi:hypothetical protein
MKSVFTFKKAIVEGFLEACEDACTPGAEHLAALNHVISEKEPWVAALAARYGAPPQLEA